MALGCVLALGDWGTGRMLRRCDNLVAGLGNDLAGGQSDKKEQR